MAAVDGLAEDDGASTGSDRKAFSMACSGVPEDQLTFPTVAPPLGSDMPMVVNGGVAASSTASLIAASWLACDAEDSLSPIGSEGRRTTSWGSSKVCCEGVV